MQAGPGFFDSFKKQGIKLIIFHCCHRPP
ncbi:MAG: hypothetical protein PVH88_23000 [Ignavibacteria bacterium]